MSWIEIASLVINLVLGGTLIVTLATLKATVNKAEAEVKQAEAEVKQAEATAERLKNDNDRSAMSTFNEFIVEPLKVEIKRLNRTINGLQKAIKQANACPRHDDCPVLDELHKQQDDDDNGDAKK